MFMTSECVGVIRLCLSNRSEKGKTPRYAHLSVTFTFDCLKKLPVSSICGSKPKYHNSAPCLSCSKYWHRRKILLTAESVANCLMFWVFHSIKNSDQLCSAYTSTGIDNRGKVTRNFVIY